MKQRKVVSTQKELDKALEEGCFPVLLGDGWFRVLGSSHVVAWGSSHVEARDSSHVVAWDSSHVVAWSSSHVVARGSSHVVARGSSHVEARDSSHVAAWDSSHVVAWDSSHVVAGKYVSVHSLFNFAGKIKGGNVILLPDLQNVDNWLDYHGVEKKRGKAVLFKAVDDDFKSGYEFDYTPGTKPEAPDWNDRPGCGGGLHLCAHPINSQAYFRGTTRFLACEVSVKDIVPIDSDKVKVRKIAKIWEVDRHGKDLE